MNEPDVRIYPDIRTSVHMGDTVRYIRWDWQDSKFYQKTGIVTEIRNAGFPGDEGAIGVHFSHHARGTNLLTAGRYFRLVECIHQITPIGGTKQNHEFPKPGDHPLIWHPGKHGWQTHDGYRRHAHSMNGLLTVDPHDSRTHFQGGIPFSNPGQPVTDRTPALGDD